MAPYMLSAVGAVLDDKVIEDCVKGKVNGNDAGAGFEEDWIQILELNPTIVADGTKEKVNQVKKQFAKGKLKVFQGEYVGIDPFDETDTYDLKQEYKENEKLSAPTFHYVLKDVIKVLED